MSAAENADYRGPLCGDETCELCPTSDDMEEFFQRQQDDARQIVRYILGLDPGSSNGRRDDA